MFCIDRLLALCPVTKMEDHPCNCLFTHLQLKLLVLSVVLYSCELDLSYQVKYINSGCLRMKQWGKYLDPRGGGDFIILHYSCNIIQVIKSRMRWLEHIACMWEIRNTYKVLVGRHNEEVTMPRQVLGEWNGCYWPKKGQYWPLRTQLFSNNRNFLVQLN